MYIGGCWERLRSEMLESCFMNWVRDIAIEGCIITIDTMDCQYEIADKIVKKGADYVFSLKGNLDNIIISLFHFGFNTCHSGAGIFYSSVFSIYIPPYPKLID